MDIFAIKQVQLIYLQNLCMYTQMFKHYTGCTHVKWVPCHSVVTSHQVVDGAEVIKIRWITANI